MRRAVCAAAAVALSACALAPPAIAEGLRLTEAGNPGFPERSFVLTGPAGASFSAGQIDLRENGKQVTGLEAVSARTARGGQLGLVLVIDASGSMKGRPIAAATEAARALASHRNPRQPLAILSFNRRPSVLLPFTTDERMIRQALSRPPALGKFTRLYDALAKALVLVESQGVKAGSVVLLSDGDDGGSHVSAKQAAALANAAGVRLFTVGLESSSLDATALERLAAQAHGRYFKARGPDDLAPIYDQLGAELSRAFLLTYRSHAGPGLKALVEARVSGIGMARTTYLTPETPRSVGAYERSVADSFWTSTPALVLVSLVCALPFGFILVAFIRRRKGTVLTRLARFVSMSQPAEEKRAATVFQEQVLSGAEKSLEQTRWWPRFKEELEIASVGIPAIQLVAWTVAGTLGMMLLLYLVAAPLALLAFIVPLCVRALIKRKLERQRKLFSEQLGENCEVLASAMRSGHSLVGALSVVIEEAAEPSRREFGRVVADEQLGVPLDQGFTAVARRMASTDLEQVAMVASLQRDTGGNTAEVLDRVADGIRARGELRRMVQTLTAQGRLTRGIVSALPIGLLGIITVVNPDYVKPLFTEPGGHVVLAIAAVLVVAGSLVIKRIVDIKV
jgi:tight adherence protein B